MKIIDFLKQAKHRFVINDFSQEVKPNKAIETTGLTEVIIEPKDNSILSNLFSLWDYRHLLVYFSLRIASQRYKETILGWLWLIIRPLVSSVLFSVVFGGLANIPSDGIPYILFFITGMSNWYFFQQALIFITRSLSSNRKFITKLYFPRIIIPIASMAAPMVEFLVYILVLIGVAVFYYLINHKFYILFRYELLLSIFFTFLTVLFVLGVGLWTSVLNSQARDVRLTLPFLLQMWFYITPVIYPISLVPEKWQWLVILNPMAVIIEGFKWSVLGIGIIHTQYIFLTCVVISLTLISGLWFFSKAETQFVDSL